MLNQVNFIGRLGKAPELRKTQNGTSVCSFSMAVNSGFGDKKETVWANIVAWSKLADNCNQYLKKGSLVFFSGRYTERAYDKSDGSKGYAHEFIANDIKFLDSKPQGQQQGYPPPASQPVQNNQPPQDDLPF